MNKHRYNQAVEEIRNATKFYAAEKSGMISRLSKYSDEHPPLNLKWPAFLYGRELIFALAVFAVIVIGGGGTLAAAENSYPGDFLYPIKLSVNESIRGVAYATTAGKATFEAWRTGRRLAEAESLALYGRLDDVTQGQIQLLLEKSTMTFSELEKQLVEKGELKEAKAAQGQFDAEVGAHSRIIDAVKNRTEGKSSAAIRSIEEAVHKNISDSIGAKREAKVFSTAMFGVDPAASMDATSTPTSTPKGPAKSDDSAQKARSRVKSLIEKTRDEIDKNYSEASELQKDILEDARSALQSAENSLERSEDRDEDESADEHEESLRASMQSIKEANISVKQSSKLKDKIESRKGRQK